MICSLERWISFHQGIDVDMPNSLLTLMNNPIFHNQVLGKAFRAMKVLFETHMPTMLKVVHGD